MNGRTRALTVLMYGLLGLFILLSWTAVFGLERMATVPLGWCTFLMFAGSGSTAALLAACILVVMVFYIWTGAAVFGVSRRRRWGTVSLVVLMTLDAAINVILTITSWWFLLAIFLDILLLMLGLLLYRSAGTE